VFCSFVREIFKRPFFIKSLICLALTSTGIWAWFGQIPTYIHGCALDQVQCVLKSSKLYAKKQTAPDPLLPSRDVYPSMLYSQRLYPQIKVRLLGCKIKRVYVFYLWQCHAIECVCVYQSFVCMNFYLLV